MSCKSLLALPPAGALVLFLIGSVSPCAWSSPTLRDVPAASSPQGPDVPKSPAEPMASPRNAAPEPLPPPEPEEPRTHTLTIYNGDKVQQQTFVWRNGSWRTSGHYDVFFRDGPRSPWRYYGTYRSPRRAEEAACSLRADGNLASVRHHCE